MALKVLQPGLNPPGQYDGLDATAANCKGGEVGAFTYVDWTTGTDKHAKDVDDGYFGTTNKRRPAVTTTLVSGMRPLFLIDEGTTGYGTLFGRTVGTNAGATQSPGSQLGPHTAAASGKITIWDKPGFYAVTLDACDTNGATGLAPTNTSLAGNDALYATTAGLLTPNVASAFEAVVVGRFVEFTTDGSLVKTPLSLVSAVNSPVSNVPGVQANAFDRAVFYFGAPF